MMKLVEAYEANDGTLWKTKEEAEKRDLEVSESEVIRLLNSFKFQTNDEVYEMPEVETEWLKKNASKLVSRLNDYLALDTRLSGYRNKLKKS